MTNDDTLDRITHARRVQAAFGLDGSHPDGVHVPLDALTGPGTHANAHSAREEAWQAVTDEMGRLAADLLGPEVATVTEPEPTWIVAIAVGPDAARTETWCVRAPDQSAAQRAALEDAREALPGAVLTVGTPIRGLPGWDATTTLDRDGNRFVTYSRDSKVAATFHPEQRIRGEDVHHDYDHASRRA